MNTFWALQVWHECELPLFTTVQDRHAHEVLADAMDEMNEPAENFSNAGAAAAGAARQRCHAAVSWARASAVTGSP